MYKSNKYFIVDVADLSATFILISASKRASMDSSLSHFESKYARKISFVTYSIVSTSEVNPRVVADSIHSASTQNDKFTIHDVSEDLTPESVSLCARSATYLVY